MFQRHKLNRLDRCARTAVQTAFRDARLILHEGTWCGLRDARWEPERRLEDELFPQLCFLRRAYPDLEGFFLSVVGVRGPRETPGAEELQKIGRWVLL